MEIAKYILNKIRQQNEACEKAIKLEYEIDNYCNLSGFKIWEDEYRETKGKLIDSVAPINKEKLIEIANKI